MKISNEAKIGILATITLIMAIWGYRFLKGQNIIDRSLILSVDYLDAEQINKSSPIYFRGVEIGTIKEIVFKPENGTKATLILNFKQNPGIPKNAHIVLFSNGPLNGKALKLEFDKICSGGDCAQTGDVLVGRNMSGIETFLGKPEELDQYISKLTKALTSVFDTIKYSVKQPDSEVGKSIRDIQATLASLRATTAVLNQVMAASAGTLNASMKNVESITSNLNANNDKINKLLSNINDMTGKANTIDFSKINAATEGVGQSIEELKKTLGETTKSLATLTKTFQNVNSGSGTLGQLATNDSVYTSLNLTLMQTQSLMQDLRLNPKRYVNFNPFRKYKPYVVPSKDPLLDTLQMRYNATKKN